MTITLATLRTDVRQRADMENSQFVTDAEVNGFISSSYGKFYDLLVTKFADYYVDDPIEFTLSAGEDSYTLTSTFYKILGLDLKVGNNEYRPLRIFTFEDRNHRSASDVLRGIHPQVRYRILGNKIRFTPADRAQGTYRLWQVPRAATLSDDADTIDGINGWEEFIVLDAAIKCLSKEESDTSELTRQRNEIQKRIEDAAASRDIGQPERITDVSRNGGIDPFYHR